MGGLRGVLGCLGWSVAIVVIVVVLLKFVLFETARMGHNGMAPTLLTGERVLIWKNSPPRLGRIAVCEHPRGLGPVVGRVAAVGGSTIDTVKGKVRVDNQPMDVITRGATNFYNVDLDRSQSVVWGEEDLHGEDHMYFVLRKGSVRFRRTKVPTGHVYLLGDNRIARGQDSRTFGPVSASTCRGVLFMRLTPAEGLTDELAHGYGELL